ncbi:MAG: hypothetical protein ACOCXM_09640 [Myxococcota bacterium]
MGWIRSTLACGILAIATVWAGCGDSEDPGHDGGGTDATVDSDGATQDAAEQCGTQVCEDGQECCTTAEGSSCIPEGTTCEGPGSPCEGPDDCDADQECCFDQGIFSCVMEDSCEGTLIDCASTSECSDGQVCCGQNTVTCQALDDCDGPVRCTLDEECTNTGAGDCCSSVGTCAEACSG